MRVVPLGPDRGCLLAGETDHGNYHITINRDHDGPLFDTAGNQVCTMRFKSKTTPAVAEQIALAQARAEVCAKCPAHADLTETTVTCRRLSKCKGRLKLNHPAAQCPVGDWPDQKGDSTVVG